MMQTKLRWHPWAPLLIGAIVAATVFALGVRAGLAFAAVEAEPNVYGFAFITKMRLQSQSSEPGLAMLRDAIILDQAVIHWSGRERRRDGWMEAAEWMRVRYGARPHAAELQELIARTAEFRLAHFNVGSARWQQASEGCGGREPMNLVGRFDQAAIAYSRVLGRAVDARELAPPPGFKAC